MTEEEAKTKWCPVANTRFIAAGEPRMASDRCIGSACMAWRYDVPDPATYEGTAPGFCGLAGRP